MKKPAAAAETARSATPIRARSWASRAVALGGVLAVLAAAGCFVDPINRAPVVISISPSGPVVRGQPASFTAVVSDPDGDTLTTTWAYGTGACPSTADASTWPAAMTSTANTYTVPKNVTMSRFCVWAFATDRYGAVGALNLDVDPTNRPPIARLKIVRPDVAPSYPLYSDFVLSGGDSSDPDADMVVFSPEGWKLSPPLGSATALEPCSDPSFTGDSFRCLRPDIAGTYVATLVVADGTGPIDKVGVRASDPASLSIVVLPDQLPCIRVTRPSFAEPQTLLRSASETFDFVIDMIEDDGDPFPPGAGPLGEHFSWTYGPTDDPTKYNAPDSFDLTIFAGQFTLGDTARVRVEINDRRPDDVIKAALKSCGDVPLCALDPARLDCYQRVTWNVAFTLPPGQQAP